MSRGQQSTYDQGVADEVCRRVAAGESLRAVCRAEGMPAESTVREWVSANESFAAQYARARDDRAEVLFDQMFEIADDARNDFMEKLGDDGQAVGWRENGELVRRSALRIDTRKWALARMAPKKFGDRLAVDSKSEVTVREDLDLSPLTKRQRDELAKLLALARGGKG